MYQSSKISNRKERRLRILPKVLLSVIGISVFIGIFDIQAGSLRGKDKKIREAEARSRYYYYEGLRQELLGNNDGAYECFRRAVESDSTNVDALYALGTQRFGMQSEDAQGDKGAKKSLEMLRKYVDRYPGDFDESLMYGYMSGYLDTTGESIRVLEQLRTEYPDRSTILIYLSQAYQGEGKMGKAMEMLDLYERNEGPSGPLSMHKISMLMESQDTVRAIREVNKLIESDSNDYNYRILKGNLYEVLNEPDSAKNNYKIAEQMAPEASSPKLALMELYRNLGDSTAYDNKVYEVLQTEDMEPEEKLGLLAQYLQKLINDKSDTRRGDTLFKVLEQQYPHHPEMLSLSARYKWAKRDTTGAIEAMSYSLDMQPESVENWQTLVYYLVNSHRYEDALATLDKISEKVGLNEPMKFYKGLILNDRKRYDEAMEVYREMVKEIDPKLDIDRKMSLKDVRRDISLEGLNTLSIIYQSMGDCQHAKGDTARSFEYYETALEFDPGNTVAANNYAYFLAISGQDLDKAEQMSEQSMRNGGGDNPTNMDTLAWIYYLKGKYKEAYELQSKAIEKMQSTGEPDPEALVHYEKIKEALKISE